MSRTFLFENKRKENSLTFRKRVDENAKVIKINLFYAFTFTILKRKQTVIAVSPFYNTNCNAVTFYTTGFESFSIFILDCWSIINLIFDDNILDLRWLWLGSGARHSLCDPHLSSYTSSFRSDQH